MTTRRALLETVAFVLIAAAGYVGCWSLIARAQPPGLGPPGTYYYTARGARPVAITDGGTAARSVKQAQVNLGLPSFSVTTPSGFECADEGFYTNSLNIINCADETRYGEFDNTGLFIAGNGVSGDAASFMHVQKSSSDLDGILLDITDLTSPGARFKFPDLGGSSGPVHFLARDSTQAGYVFPRYGLVLPHTIVHDARFIVADDSDTTKKIAWQASGITTGTTRTLTPQDASYTIAGTNLAQTFTAAQTITPSTDVTGLIVTPSSGGVSDIIQGYDNGSGGTLVFAVGQGGRVNAIAYDINKSGFTGSIEAPTLGGNRTWTMPVYNAVMIGSTAALTSGRVPLVTTNGRLQDDADLTFAADSLVSTRVRIPTSLRVGSDAAITALGAGTYTPTRSAEANITGTVTMTVAQWMRVGNTVTVSGRFTVDPTTTLTATSFEITLPVASNIANVQEVAGVAYMANVAGGEGAEVIGVVANDTAKFQWVAVDVASQTWTYQFTFQVL